MNNENNFEKYAAIKKQIADLEAEAKALQPAIIEFLINNNEKLQLNCGEFGFRKTKKWTYPEYIKQYEEFIEAFIEPHKAKLEGKKKEAELNGEAKVEITQTLVFKAPKP